MSEALVVSEEQLSPARLEDFAPHQSVVGMLGFPGSGKTVFSSVFSYIVNKNSQDFQIDAVLEDGFSAVRANLEYLLEKHTFPPATEKTAVQTTKIRMIRKGRFRDKNVILHVNDMAGEIVRNLVDGDQDPVSYLLTYLRPQTSPVGPFAYLLFAKAFVVVIDCAESAHWETRQLDYTKLLQVIVKVKRNEKLSVPVAFVFTKYDMLPDNMQQASGADLLGKMPILNNYLKRHFKLEKVKPVVVNIAVERDPNTGAPVPNQYGNHIPTVPISVPTSNFKDFIEWAFASL